MATNPTITPYTNGSVPYTVGQSDVAYFDVQVSNLGDNPDLSITAPLGATVHAWTLAGAEAVLRWVPGTAAVVLLTGGAWVSSATIGGWSVSVSPGTTPADTTTLTFSNGSDGPLRVRVTGIRAGGPGGQATLNAGANTATLRVLADPRIIGTPGPTATPVVERTEIELTAAAGPAYVVDPSPPPASFGTLPTVLGEWSRTSTDPTFELTAKAPFGAIFMAPGVYADAPQTFLFRAYYDLNASGTFADPEPDNVEPVAFTVMAALHRMVLVLDRSGSMSSGLGGDGVSKWERTRRAAHAWMDLFAAFRAGSGQQAGLLTFEQDLGGYGTCASSADVTLRNPNSGDPTSVLSNLTTFATVNPLNLGTPQTLTPIGDGLNAAFNTLNTGLGDLDRCTVVLLTDGMENTGCKTFRTRVPAAGVTRIIDALGPLGSHAALTPKLALYAIGLGAGMVDESDLNALTSVPGLNAHGRYSLTTDTRQLLLNFAEMLGHSIEGERAPTTIVGDVATFTSNSAERRVVVLVPWETPPASTIEIQHRQQGTTDPFVTLGATGVTRRDRQTHGIVVVDLTAPGGLGTAARDWQVRRLVGGAAQPLTGGVLAMVDLHLKVDVKLDKPYYRTGEPMLVTATILAGNERVTGATVRVEPEKPEEGQGTYMSTHGAKAAGPLTITQILRDERHGKLREALRQGGADPLMPKAALFSYYLNQDGTDALKRGPGIFTDGTNELFDDGAHTDGPADDGVYANTFGGADKEGTYTFRLRAEGTLADGSRFERVVTISTWVGVRVDPKSSPVTVTTVASPPPGMVVQLIAITPRSKAGEYLGPFRPELVQITASAGTFRGEVETRIDGSYARTLEYREGEDPVIDVIVDDVPVPVQPAPPKETCWQLFVRLIRCLLKKIGL